MFLKDKGSQRCKEEYIGETGCLVRKGINIYRQHMRQPQHQQLAVEEYLRTCGDGKFQIFPFFKMNNIYYKIICTIFVFSSDNKWLYSSFHSLIYVMLRNMDALVDTADELGILVF